MRPVPFLAPRSWALLLALVLPAAACREGEGRTSKAPPPSASAQASSPARDGPEAAIPAAARDPKLAGVFRLAGGAGMGEALDSLEALAAADPRIRRDGHQIAHSLGRFAVARRGYRPEVFAECRPDFQSGCYHGVLEAYLERAPVDAKSIDALCASIVRPDAPRLQYRECAHGLGHGLMGRFAHDIHPALAACEHLGAEDGRVECYDGVFMENVIFSLGFGGAGEGAAGGAGAQGGGHQHGHGGAHRTFVKADDPRFPCDSVAPRHQPSCWTYQHSVLRHFGDGELGTALRGCEQAPGASRASCARGVGKQAASERTPDHAATVAVCRAGPAALVGPCIAGAAEYYVDLRWTTDPAHAFCAAVPGELGGSCYGMIGERLALMHPRPAPIRADCRRAGPRHEGACLRGAGVD